MDGHVLKIRSLDVAYGGLKALSDVSLDVEEGQFVAVVGPNGAGKTTLFKTISGMVTPLAGEIAYKGRRPACRRRRPSAHSSASPTCRKAARSSPRMTVMENLEMGAYARNGRAASGGAAAVHHRAFPGSRGAARPARRHACRAASSRCWRSGAD